MVEFTRYLDVNVFIYWLGNHPSHGKAAYQWIKRAENASPGKYVTSTLTLYETLVIIAGLTGSNLKDKTLINKVLHPITAIQGLTITPLKPEDFIHALNLMKRHHLDYEDSLHLATALRTGVQEIVSNDKDFEKTTLKRTF